MKHLLEHIRLIATKRELDEIEAKATELGMSVSELVVDATQAAANVFPKTDGAYAGEPAVAIKYRPLNELVVGVTLAKNTLEQISGDFLKARDEKDALMSDEARQACQDIEDQIHSVEDELDTTFEVLRTIHDKYTLGSFRLPTEKLPQVETITVELKE